MPSTLSRNIKSYRAGGVIAENTFVKFDPTDDNSVLACGGNERAIGIAQSAASAEGQQIEVAVIGGGAKLLVNETVAKGQMLTSTSAGLGEVADAAGEWVGAVACEDGVQNDVIEVFVSLMQAYASDA